MVKKQVPAYLTYAPILRHSRADAYDFTEITVAGRVQQSNVSAIHKCARIRTLHAARAGCLRPIKNAV